MKLGLVEMSCDALPKCSIVLSVFLNWILQNVQKTLTIDFVFLTIEVLAFLLLSHLWWCHCGID